MGERLHGMQEVRGSNPLTSIRQRPEPARFGAFSVCTAFDGHSGQIMGRDAPGTTADGRVVCMVEIAACNSPSHGCGGTVGHRNW